MSEPTAPDSDAENPTISWRSLPPEVSRRRVEVGIERERESALLQPRIDAYLEIYGLALDALASVHRGIADGTDLDLSADNRAAAVWTVAGRCIGFARSTLSLLRNGFGAESAAQMRALHEANRLLSALADDAETDLLRQWLADKDQGVRPREARAAQERWRHRVRAAMIEKRAQAKAAGDEALSREIDDGLGLEAFAEDDSMSQATRQIYDTLSRIGHSRRSGIRDAISEPLREMAVGPHTDLTIRAEYVTYGGLLVVETLISVGHALGRFHGQGWFEAQIRPLIDRIDGLPDLTTW